MECIPAGAMAGRKILIGSLRWAPIRGRADGFGNHALVLFPQARMTVSGHGGGGRGVPEEGKGNGDGVRVGEGMDTEEEMEDWEEGGPRLSAEALLDA